MSLQRVSTFNIEHLGNILQTRRGGKSIRRTSEILEISPTTLCKIENGHIPDIKTLQKICNYLGYTLTLTVHEFY